MEHTITTTQLINLLNTPHREDFSLTLWEKLLNQTFGAEWIKDQILNHIRINAEDFLEILTQEIIDNYKYIDIISEETGEVLHTINLHNYNGEPLSEALLLENVGAYPGAKIEKDYRKIYEVEIADETEMYGMISDRDAQCYTQNGVRIHKPGYESFWSRYSFLKTVQFIDMVTGKITDEFYGFGNDFSQWFLAKASRNEKFAVMAYDREKERWYNVTKIMSAGINNVVFRNILRDSNYCWSVAG